MSLINKMLKDLETRQSVPKGDQSPEHLYRDLRPVGRRRHPYRALVSVGVILVVTATTTLLFASGHWDSSLLPTKIAQWTGTAAQDANPTNVVQVKQEGTTPAKTVITTVEPLQTSVVNTSLLTTSTKTTDSSVTQESLIKQESEPVKVEANAKAVTKKKPEIKAKATTKTETKTTTKTAVQKERPKKALAPKKVILEGKQRLAEIQPKVMVASAKPRMAGPSLNAVSKEEVPTGVSERGAVERKLRTLTQADQAEEAYREGVQSLQQNRVDQAQEKLRFAVATDPQHVEARELLAGLLMRRGALVEAEPLLNDGLAANPEHYRFAQLLARIHIQRGASKQALTLLEQSQPYAETDAEFFGFLAALYQRAGQHENAIKAYTRAVTINPQQSQWWLGLGISFEAKRNWNAAYRAYRRAVASRQLNRKLGRYARERLASVQRKVASSN
jgi:MSHA biogenesis protein MshN